MLGIISFYNEEFKMSNIPQTHNIGNIVIIANFVFPHI